MCASICKPDGSMETTRGLQWAWDGRRICVRNGSKHVVGVQVGTGGPIYGLDIGCFVYETPGNCEVRLSHYTENRELKTILLMDGGARMTVTITPMVAPSCYTKDRAAMMDSAVCVRRRGWARIRACDPIGSEGLN
jgi:hypothetical protein